MTLSVPTMHRDDWPCDGGCEVCYPLTGQPDLEADAMDQLVQDHPDARHAADINRLAAIICRIRADVDLGPTALAAAILNEWTQPLNLSWGEKNLIVNLLAAEPVDEIVNPQSMVEEIRALRDRISGRANTGV